MNLLFSFSVALATTIYMPYKDVFVTLITLFNADDLIFFSEDHKGSFFINSYEKKIFRKMENIISIVELLSYETTI